MTTQEKVQLMAIVYNDALRKSDAVICLEGDGYERLGKTVEIFKQGLARKIVVSGGFNNPPFSIIAGKMAAKLVRKGVPKGRIIIEEKSQNTYQQGLEIMKLAKKKKWKRIILVASNFHQPRAYLTFLKAMKNAKMKIQIFNASASELPWFTRLPSGTNRIKLLAEEFKKIDEYSKKGYLVNIKETLKYQQWKEKQK